MIDLYFIQIDLTPLFTAAGHGPLAFAFFIFIKVAWPLFLLFFIYAAYIFWLLNKQAQYAMAQKYVILAIDIPRDTEQTPKAVEQIFSTISGAHSQFNAKELKLEGKFQLAFSFEIISIDGYIQFLIRTPEAWRDLVESSIYAQYPDAEITSVEDYVEEVPNEWPNDDYNMWATEVIPVRKWVYPIRTYTFFEDAVSGEFKDPLAAILETMSKIQKKERVWLQILVKPTDHTWTAKSAAEAMKMAGKGKKESKKGIFDTLFGWIGDLLFLSTGESMFLPDRPIRSPSKDKKKDDMPPSMMLHLTPGERGALEAIENKAAKIGFLCKMRLLYISPKDQYNPGRVVSAVFGSLKQYSTNDLNAWRPDPKTKTKINYWRIKPRENQRRRNIIRAYKWRSGIMGATPYILNTEELASLWHFPAKTIRSPLLQKTETKKAEPPSTLPFSVAVDEVTSSEAETLREQLKTTYDFDLNNKYFEQRFAKKNEPKIESKHSDDHNRPPANLPIN